jgi:hypothetical protein
VAEHETDLTAMAKGVVSLTPLDFNMTRQTALAEMQRWKFDLENASQDRLDPPIEGWGPVLRAARRRPRAVADIEQEDHGPDRNG